MPKQNNHNKRTHDSLLDRVYDALEERYGYDVEKEVDYEAGELDIIRYENGKPTVYYEVKSNHRVANYQKAEKQIKRFINYKEGTINTDKMDIYRNGVYISQSEIGGKIKAEKVL